jgi:FkbM family methyltransferase
MTNVGPNPGGTASASTPRNIKLREVVLSVADDQPTFWDKVESGLWEPETLALLDQQITPGTTFLDLGAWVGPTALYAAACGARVIALEADPVALAQLHRNLAVNPALAQRIEILARAVHAAEGRVPFGARRKPGDSMSSVLIAPGTATWMADTITPLALAARIGAGGRLFVKLDIEGGEYELLPSMRPLVDRADCRVLVSFHPGILATAMPDAAQREAATARALEVFSGFAPHALERSGLFARKPDAAAIAAGAAPDKWLFVRD